MFILRAGSDKKRIIEVAWEYFKNREVVIRKYENKIIKLKKSISEEYRLKKISDEIMKETAASIKP